MKTRTVALPLAVLLLVMTATTALADTRIAVLPVGGPAGAKAEAAIRKALAKRDGVQVIPAGAVKTAIRKHGRKVEALARALNADIVFVSLTQKAGKNMKLNIGVYDAEGTRLGGNGWSLKKGDMTQVVSGLWAELGPSMKKAEQSTAVAEAKKEEEEAPVQKSPRKEAADDAFAETKTAEAAPKTAAIAKVEQAPKTQARSRDNGDLRSSSDDDDARSSSSSNEVTLSSTRSARRGGSDFGDLDAELGMHAFTRSFSYNQPLRGSLASYRLTSGPAIAGGAEWYAGKLAGEGFARNIGLGVMAESAFGIGSQAQDGSRVGTSAYAFDVGPRVRVPLAGHRLTFGGGYGQRVFGVEETDDPVLSMVPDVSYKFISVRAGGRFNLSEQLSVNGSLAYLHLLGTGELGSDRYFPRLSGAGIEANAYVGYAVTPRWEARVGVDLTRFFFALKPEPGDQNVAGGAVDQFFAATARIAYRL